MKAPGTTAPARLAASLACALALVHCAAGAGVFRHVDPVSGMVVLSNRPPAQAAAPAVAQDRPRTAARAFPHVSPVRQRQMDGDRRAILQDELDHERRAHAAASASRAAREVLARHTANIAALQRELAALAGTPTN